MALAGTYYTTIIYYSQLPYKYQNQNPIHHCPSLKLYGSELSIKTPKVPSSPVKGLESERVRGGAREWFPTH